MYTGSAGTRRTYRRSDRTSVRQRGLTAFVLGFDRPESMYIYKTGVYTTGIFIYTPTVPTTKTVPSAVSTETRTGPRFRKGPRGRATSERLRGMAHDGAGGVPREINETLRLPIHGPIHSPLQPYVRRTLRLPILSAQPFAH